MKYLKYFQLAKPVFDIVLIVAGLLFLLRALLFEPDAVSRLTAIIGISLMALGK